MNSISRLLYFVWHHALVDLVFYQCVSLQKTITPTLPLG